MLPKKIQKRYPEKIPFRLTRMLINALEVSGVEGNYRHAAEGAMWLLRESKDTVLPAQPEPMSKERK